MNKTVLIIIFIIAAVLRLLFLDKAGGLWYDELVSYEEAVQNDIFSVISYTLKIDVHFPLYQIFLHIWSNIFSFSDLSLRLFSVIFGFLTVVISYFAGKELKDKNCGLISASVFAVNSFFIYYSQEVRLYSFLLFLITLNLFSIIKLRNNFNDKKNYLYFIFSSSMIIYTHTISFIYVFGVLFGVLLYFILKKQHLKKLLYSYLFIFLICLPIFLFIIFNFEKYTSQINGYYCDYSSIFIIFQDLFTPVLESLLDNPCGYFSKLFAHFSFSVLFFILLPLLCAIFGIFTAIKKDKFCFVLISGSMLFLLAEIIAFNITDFKILPRYASDIMPSLLIVMSYGFSLLNVNKSKAIVVLFIFINLFFLIFSPQAAYKQNRNGFKTLAGMLNEIPISKNDYILLWNRREILDKYIPFQTYKVSLLKDFAYRSETMLQYEKDFKSSNLDKRKNILYKYFYDNIVPENTEQYMNFIINDMKKHQKFIITMYDKFETYNKEVFKELLKNTNFYEITSFNDLLTIKTLTDIKKLCDEKLNYIETKKQSPFIIIVYEK